VVRRLALVVPLALPCALVRIGTAAGLVPPVGGIGAWLRAAPPADVVATLAWAAATVLAAWLGACTLLYAALAATGATRACRRVGALLPGVRPLLDRALGVGLAASVALGPVAAHAAVPTSPTTGVPPPTGGIVVRTGPDGRFVVGRAGEGVVHAPTTTTTVLPAPRAAAPQPTSTTVPPPKAPATPPTAAPDTVPTTVPRPTGTAPTARADVGSARRTAPRHHRVVAGEHLWGIAADALARATGRAPSDAEIVGYWRVVCEHNRPTLRSRDPNLVFPGELVALPPVPGLA
jgi:hypothetical protein